MTNNYASLPEGTHPPGADAIGGPFGAQLPPTDVDVPNNAERAHQGEGDHKPLFAAVAAGGIVKIYDVVMGQRVDVATTTLTAATGTVPYTNDNFFAATDYYDPNTNTQYFRADGYEGMRNGNARASVSITAHEAGLAVYKENVVDGEGLGQYRTAGWELAFLESDAEPLPDPSVLTIGAKTRRVTFSRS